MKKASEIRNLEVDQLEKELARLQRESFDLRNKKAIKQLTTTHELKQNRRTIAQVRTIITEKNKKSQ
ncbi:50S ribosomal protein L29 [bacterium]|nr:50S ribosomal protein L29 [bacterium]